MRRHRRLIRAALIHWLLTDPFAGFVIAALALWVCSFAIR